MAKLESFKTPDCTYCSDLPQYYAARNDLRAARAVVQAAVQSSPQVFTGSDDVVFISFIIAIPSFHENVSVTLQCRPLRCSHQAAW